MVGEWGSRRALSRKQTESNVLSSSAETFAITKNKNEQRALWQKFAIISLEAKISFKAQTAVINCTRAKSAKFLESTSISMVRASSGSQQRGSNNRSHTVPPANRIRYTGPERSTSLPELALRRRLYRTPKSHRTKTMTAQPSVECRIQNWMESQIKFNSNTGILSQNLLVH